MLDRDPGSGTSVNRGRMNAARFIAFMNFVAVDFGDNAAGGKIDTINQHFQLRWLNSNSVGAGDSVAKLFAGGQEFEHQPAGRTSEREPFAGREDIRRY